MGETTAISWTGATWNPWQGCRKISAGCDRCYAETLTERWGREARINAAMPGLLAAWDVELSALAVWDDEREAILRADPAPSAGGGLA